MLALIGVVAASIQTLNHIIFQQTEEFANNDLQELKYIYYHRVHWLSPSARNYTSRPKLAIY